MALVLCAEQFGELLGFLVAIVVIFRFMVFMLLVYFSDLEVFHCL